MMFYASLLPFYQAPSAAAFESMSFANYLALFNSTKTITPMINSAILGPTVATAVILIVALIAYFVHKTQIRGRRLLDFLAFAPIAIKSAGWIHSSASAVPPAATILSRRGIAH